MIYLQLLLLCFGCGLLYLGGQWLVDGISGLSEHLRVPSVITAFVVMGFGTSAPELFVAIRAALAGSPDIVVGNIVGSNIANLLLVLGLVALVAPLSVDRDILRIDGAAMLLVTVVFAGLAFDGTVSLLDAGLLIAGTAAYLTSRWRSTLDPGIDTPSLGLGRVAGLAAAGLLALPFGAHLFVGAAVGLAERLEVSEALIGLTVVAVGTSLPEMAACLVAAARKQAGIVLGGILGSNVFNMTVVAAGAATVAPLVIAPTFTGFWIPVSLIATIVTLVFLRTGLRLTRSEGAVMLAGYAGIFVL